MGRTSLIAEYAYVLKPGGILYTVTDVKGTPPLSSILREKRGLMTELHEWMAAHLKIHPMFDTIPNEELVDDPCLEAARVSTEEGKKVERNNGDKWVACFRRREDPPLQW